MRDAFEAWIKTDWPEAEISLAPDGNYRISQVRAQWAAWQAAYTLGYEQARDDYTMGLS